MSTAKRDPLANYRRRLKRQGIVRVEVLARKEDAPLIRDVARALRDPQRAPEARTLLRVRFAASRAKGLKALLAAAPLEGVELERAGDTGRSVDL